MGACITKLTPPCPPPAPPPPPPGKGEEIQAADIVSMTEEQIKDIVNAEFPKINAVCNVYDLVSTCTVDNPDDNFPDAWYAVNDWVEILGNDMKWKLTRVKRVIKKAPDDWDWDDDSHGPDDQPEWEYFYNAGDAKMVREEAVRSPTEGLQRIFGMSPWLWQQ